MAAFDLEQLRKAIIDGASEETPLSCKDLTDLLEGQINTVSAKLTALCRRDRHVWRRPLPREKNGLSIPPVFGYWYDSTKKAPLIPKRGAKLPPLPTHRGKAKEVEAPPAPSLSAYSERMKESVGKVLASKATSITFVGEVVIIQTEGNTFVTEKRHLTKVGN